MNVGNVVRLFKTHHPKRGDPVLGPLGLKFIGHGSSRSCYKVRGLPLVIKFTDDTTEYGDQGATEKKFLDTIFKSKRKFKSIRKHFPKIYYFNKRTGVTLMKYYTTKKTHEFDKLAEELREILNRFEWEVSSSISDDCYSGNVGKDEKGIPILIDCGIARA